MLPGLSYLIAGLFLKSHPPTQKAATMARHRMLNHRFVRVTALLAASLLTIGCREVDQQPGDDGSHLPIAQTSAQDEANKEPEPWEIRGQQMQKIVQAISDHYDAKNGFPSYVQEGQPFWARPHLSWRVWILPELGHQELFEQFNTDEPWDSEHNLPLVEKMPEIFLTPQAKEFAERKPGSTTIQALAGDGGILACEKPGMPPSRKGITDGLSETALLVECHPSRAVPWTSPEDFPFNPAEEADVTRFGIDGEDFFLIVTVSGDLHRIRKDADVKEIDRLFQRDDQRETKWEALKYVKPADNDGQDSDAADAASGDTDGTSPTSG